MSDPIEQTRVLCRVANIKELKERSSTNRQLYLDNVSQKENNSNITEKGISRVAKQKREDGKAAEQ